MSELKRKGFSIVEVSEMTGLSPSILVTYIQREWIVPNSEEYFDEEDTSRIYLIQDLKDSFGVNDDAIPLILHLLDQLYHLRYQMRAQMRDHDRDQGREKKTST